MLLDGFWKKDLRKIKRSMKIWSRMRTNLFMDFAEHKVNQGLLFSAIIIRKIVEDEADAERVLKNTNYHMPPLPIMKMMVPIKQYGYVGDNKLFINDRVMLQNYDWDSGIDKELTLAQVCNQIIHSYLWSVVYLNSKRIYEILLVSDWEKNNVVYALTIDDWINVIKIVIDEAHI